MVPTPVSEHVDPGDTEYQYQTTHDHAFRSKKYYAALHLLGEENHSDASQSLRIAAQNPHGVVTGVNPDSVTIHAWYPDPDSDEKFIKPDSSIERTDTFSTSSDGISVFHFPIEAGDWVLIRLNDTDSTVPDVHVIRPRDPLTRAMETFETATVSDLPDEYL